jgi:T5orf172 domain
VIDSPTPTSDALARDDDAWFVYLLALSDCTAFKVGFSCNPLQRIHTFSHRYFERFDVYRSVLLRVADCATARATEAELKAMLAQFRMDAPHWVPGEAGGHTEWFSAVYFDAAEQRLRSALTAHDSAMLASTADFIRDELSRLAASFEPWAWNQAWQLHDARSSPSAWRAGRELGRSLRNWLDAYRYFDVPLFADDPAVREFVAGTAAEMSAAGPAGRRRHSGSY